MIKLFASDLDGTLLTNHVVDSIVLDAVRTIREQNRNFAVITGRTMYSHQRAELGLETFGVYTAAMNGAVLYDPEGTLLYRMEISSSLLTNMLRAFPDLMLEFNACDRVLIRQSRDSFIDFVRRDPNRDAERFLPSFLKTAEFDAAEEAVLQAGIVKINARIPHPDADNAVRQFLQENSAQAENRPFREDIPGLYEISVVGAGKEYAVRFLQKALGIQPAQTAVYGDGPNDCEMLRQCPNSFAPENAGALAKAAASQVIGNCGDHAVPRHMLEALSKSKFP